MGELLHLSGTARSAVGGATARPGPSSLYQMHETTHLAHPSTAILIIVLLYNGPLHSGFNVPIKGLTA